MGSDERHADADPQDIEPEVDPDSGRRVTEERLDPPHGPSRFDAGTGQGTVSGPPKGVAFQERPILDGSTQSAEAEASVPNPYRGETDPARMHRQPALNDTSTRRWFFAGVVAYVILAAALIALARWDPVWCGIGFAVGLLALVGMVVVRASRVQRPLRLWLDAILLTILWLVPLAIVLSVIIGRGDEIW